VAFLKLIVGFLFVSFVPSSISFGVILHCCFAVVTALVGGAKKNPGISGVVAAITTQSPLQELSAVNSKLASMDKTLESLLENHVEFHSSLLTEVQQLNEKFTGLSDVLAAAASSKRDSSSPVVVRRKSKVKVTKSDEEEFKSNSKKREGEYVECICCGAKVDSDLICDSCQCFKKTGNPAPSAKKAK